MTSKNIASKIYNKFSNLILYGVIGSCTATLDFIVYTILVSLCEVYYITANCISVLVGIVTSFVLNRAYNFKVKDKVVFRFAIFLCVGLSGMIVSNLLLYVFIDLIGIGDLLSKLLSIMMVVVFQFVLNKYITFKTSE